MSAQTLIDDFQGWINWATTAQDSPWNGKAVIAAWERMREKHQPLSPSKLESAAPALAKALADLLAAYLAYTGENMPNASHLTDCLCVSCEARAALKQAGWEE